MARTGRPRKPHKKKRKGLFLPRETGTEDFKLLTDISHLLSEKEGRTVSIGECVARGIRLLEKRCQDRRIR